MSSTDRIEKSVTLKAARARVFRAIADHAEFGRWFGVELAGPFVVGAPVRARFATMNEASVLAFAEKVGVGPHAVKMPAPDAVFCTVTRIEPEHFFAFRWVPYGIDAEADPATEPTTLVEIRLEDVPEGTRLTVVESGFDALAARRRERARRMNEGGWASQLDNVRRHVEAG